MTVYLVNIALILFWRLYFTQKRFPDARKYFCMVAAFQWILIAGLREWHIGDDTYAYAMWFEDLKTTSWETVVNDLYGHLFLGQSVKDPGYAVFVKLFQIFSENYQIFLMAVAMLFMSLMAIWIYKNSSSPCTSFVLFSTLSYSFYAISCQRQTIAAALIIFLGYDWIQERKFWKFLLISSVSFLIHKSSLVFVPLYFLFRIPVTLGYMVLYIAAITVVVVQGKSLYAPIAHWVGYTDSMINYAGGGAETYATLLVLLCALIWILYPRIKSHRSDAGMLFHVNAITLMLGMLVFQNQSFMRLQQYYAIFLLITVPEVINTVKREHRLLVYLLFGSVMILYLMHNNPQYKFFFMS